MSASEERKISDYIGKSASAVLYRLKDKGADLKQKQAEYFAILSDELENPTSSPSVSLNNSVELPLWLKMALGGQKSKQQDSSSSDSEQVGQWKKNKSQVFVRQTIFLFSVCCSK